MPLFSPLLDVDEVLINETMDINFKGALFTCRKVPLMPKKNSIVFNTRLTIRWECPIQVSMLPLKLHCDRWFALAAKLLERGIRVNAVSPGPVKPLLSAKPEFLKNSCKCKLQQSAFP